MGDRQPPRAVNWGALIARYFDISGQVALVTETWRGIGLAIARGLAESGVQVILVGSGIAGLKSVLAALGNGASALT